MKSYNFYKWRVWSILTFSFVLSLFHRGAMGVVSPHLANDLNATATQVSNIASVTFYSYALMQVPAGLLLDRFGYRKISAIGVLVTGIGSILLGLTPQLGLAYIGRLFVGLGTSVIFISVLKAQTIWFNQKEFTKASGLLSFIGNMGGMLATFPLAILVGFIGWRFSMIGMGVLCLVISGLIFLLVKNRPEDYGYDAQGHTMQPVKTNLIDSLKSVIANKAVWRNFFALFTLVGCTTAFSGVWGINYLSTIYSISGTQASFYISFVLIGLVIGSLLINHILELFHHQISKCQRVCSLLMTCCWIYFLLLSNGKPPLILLPLVFFIMGFLATAHILSFTDVTNHCEAKNSGLASSLVNSGEFISSSLITLIIGFTLDLTYTGNVINNVRQYTPKQYQICFYIFLVISLLGVLTSYIGNKKTAPEGDHKLELIN